VPRVRRVVATRVVGPVMIGPREQIVGDNFFGRAAGLRGWVALLSLELSFNNPPPAFVHTTRPSATCLLKRVKEAGTTTGSSRLKRRLNPDDTETTTATATARQSQRHGVITLDTSPKSGERACERDAHEMRGREDCKGASRWRSACGV
jgi:hypothetical protein